MRLRRFITAFVCLSTLAFAQNVVAGTSMPESGRAATQAEMEHQSKIHTGNVIRVGGESPNPSSMMLFVCGLAGLTAAGSRRSESDGELA